MTADARLVDRLVGDPWTDDRLDLPHIIRLTAGPLIFLGGCLIGWRLGRAR